MTLACHESAIFDLAFSSDDMRLGTASGDQTARIFDIQKQTCTDILHPNDQTSVKQIKFSPTSNEIIISSTRGGTIALFDRRTVTAIDNEDGIAKRLPCGQLARAQNPEKGRRARSSHSRSVTSVEFLDEYTIVSAGEGSRVLRVWDIRKFDQTRRYLQPLAETSVPYNDQYGITSLGIDRIGARIWALGRDNCLYAYALLDGQQSTEPIEVLRHPRLKVDTFYVKLSVLSDPNAISAAGLASGYVSCGSSDGSVVVFPSSARCKNDLLQMEKDERRRVGTAFVNGHRKEASGLSWTDTGSLLSISDDMTARRWKFNRNPLLAEEIRNRWRGREHDIYNIGEGYSEALEDSLLT